MRSRVARHLVALGGSLWTFAVCAASSQKADIIEVLA